MFLPHWLEGLHRRLFPHWFSGRARRHRFRLRERRRPELSLIPAYVDVLEERVLLSSFAMGTETLVNGTIPGDQKFSAQTDRSFTATPDGGH